MNETLSPEARARIKRNQHLRQTAGHLRSATPSHPPWLNTREQICATCQIDCPLKHRKPCHQAAILTYPGSACPEDKWVPADRH